VALSPEPLGWYESKIVLSWAPPPKKDEKNSFEIRERAAEKDTTLYAIRVYVSALGGVSHLVKKGILHQTKGYLFHLGIST
jgi:hypothetical protein